jgi:hypothetical protein
MLANPVSDLHMIGMGVLGKTGGLRLLRREKPLLAFSDLEKPLLSIPVVPWHTTQSYN